jgi:hypothetical protein
MLSCILPKLQFCQAAPCCTVVRYRYRQHKDRPCCTVVSYRYWQHKDRPCCLDGVPFSLEPITESAYRNNLLYITSPI